jgi:signal transduction histidine kinase/ligand-binding sensor domain-containing protein
LALCNCCLAPVNLAAFNPNYVTRFWQTDDGVPQSSVTAVLQSRDGYIWLGTRSGLARFDGVRFVAFNGGNTPEMQSPHVTCLFESADGALWIGHEDGEVTCYEGGKFRSVPVKAAWRGGKIFGIGADRNGDIWFVNQAGELARLKDGLVIPAAPGPVTRLLGVARNPLGGFWLQRDNEVLAVEDGTPEPLSLEGPAKPYIQGVAASRDGGLWIMTENRMRKWKDGKWLQDLGPAPWEWAPVHTVIELKDGRFAAATADHGLFIVSTELDSLHFCRSNGFSSDWVTSLCQDREGNLWAGTGNGGLAVLRPGHVSTLNSPDRWEGRAVLSVATDADGALWIGTEGAGLYRFHDGTWTNYQGNAGIGNYYVWSVTQDAEKRMWAGTWGGGLLVRNFMQFEVPPELADLSAPIPALLPMPNGRMLVGTGVGLLEYTPGKVTWLGRTPELFSPDVRAVRAAPDGTIWFGMSGGGLGCLQQGKLRQFRRAEGLGSDFVQCLHLEPDGTLWIGTFGGGLNRLKNGRFTAITKNQGLPDDVICDIEDDGLGNFWISSHGGLTRIKKTDLNNFADNPTNGLHCLSYGLSDGLPTLECSGGFQPAGCRTADGRLWFPTARGVVAVDPANVKINHLPPPVVIEEMRVDGHTVSINDPKNPTRIEPGSHRYQFDYTGLSFVAPEKVRFRYRLAGLDADWFEAQAERRANYSHIPPGDYKFQVRACNNDGVWNDAGATIAFTVLPAFYQTWWFRMLAGAFGIGAAGWVAWFDTRRRMHRKLELLEREQAIERERARIAKDIHDDLGAGLTRISLLSESVPAEQAGSPKAMEAFNRIFTTTHEMTQAMDEIVWAVNPKHDTIESLANYLSKFAQDFLDSAGVACRLDVPLQLPNWRLAAEIRHNLFLAFKESMNNVARHAAATEVRITLVTRADSFVMVVEDNGKGFDPTTGAASGTGRFSHRNGLANMRQRLSEIGGRCEITSTPGKGTRVEFLVSLKPGIA